MYNRRLTSSRRAQYMEILAFILSFVFVLAIIVR